MRSLIVEDVILSRELLVAKQAEHGRCGVAQNGKEVLLLVCESLNEVSSLRPHQPRHPHAGSGWPNYAPENLKTIEKQRYTRT